MMTDLHDKLGGKLYIGKDQLKQAEQDMKDGKKGPVVMVANMKSTDRLREKTETENNGNYSQVGDLVRGTIAVDSISDIPHVIKTLGESGITLARAPKDRYSEAGPAQHGYRDILLNVKMPNGHIAELQINTKAMVLAKNTEGHKHYETERVIIADVNNTQTPPNKAQMKALQGAVRSQQRIYGGAWRKIS